MIWYILFSLLVTILATFGLDRSPIDKGVVVLIGFTLGALFIIGLVLQYPGPLVSVHCG